MKEDIWGKLSFFPLSQQAIILCLSLRALSGCRHTTTNFAI